MKERIVGAAILVLFAVLVVPVFLDGPPSSAERVTESVLLPGQDAQKMQTVVLDRHRTDPVPVAGKAAEKAAKPVPKAEPLPVEKVAAPVVEQAPEVKPKQDSPPPAVVETPAASATGMWAVQLGSFSNKENAEKLAADLRKQGYAAFLSRLATDSGSLHRVRIGPQKDRESAEATAARLKKAGHAGQVVPHP